MQVEADLKDAMRAGDTARRDALRLLRAALKNAEIERRGSDAGPMQEAMSAPCSRSKSNSAAIASTLFRQGAREDLAAKEESEIAVFQGYLPQAMDASAMRDAAESSNCPVGRNRPERHGQSDACPPGAGW